MIRSKALSAGILALLALGVFVWSMRDVESTNEGVERVPDACSNEAKVCADGSKVFRTDVNCAFAACPATPALVKPTTPATQNTPKPLPPTSTQSFITARYNEKVTIRGVSITPILILEDNRCPSDAQCVSAGVIKIQTRIVSGATTTDQFLEIGKAYVSPVETITLIGVTPQPKINQPIGSNLYRFTFEVTKR